MKKNTTDPGRKAAGRRIKNGVWHVAVTSLLLAALVILNLVVSAIPGRLTTKDVSQGRLFSIGESTLALLSSLDEDVTLNYIEMNGTTDETLLTLLVTYEGASGHVKLKRISATRNPAFLSQFGENIKANDVIVTAGDKHTVVDYDSVYQYSMGYDYSYTVTGFDGEGQITSAITYVTQKESPGLYYTTGHGEAAFSSYMTAWLDKAFIPCKAIALVSSEIPDDCGALFINAPAADFTEAEAEKVLFYLENGGHVMIVTGSPVLTQETPNLNRVLEAYGISRSGGVVFDPSLNGNYYGMAELVCPQKSELSEITAPLADYYILDAAAEGIVLSDEGEQTWSQTALLTTSDEAYEKPSLDSRTQDREDGDKEGPFVLGAAVEQTFSRDSDGEPDVPVGTEEAGEEEKGTGSTRLLYYSSAYLFDADLLYASQLEIPEGNMKLFQNSMSWLFNEKTTVAVPVKEYQVERTVIPWATSGLISLVLAIILPAAVIGSGLVIWIRRRRR